MGNPEAAANTILRHSEAPGGIDQAMFRMDNAALPHTKLMRSIELIGTRIAPLLTRQPAWHELLPERVYHQRLYLCRTQQTRVSAR